LIRKAAVLGAGPAGLWLAKTLLETYPDLHVTVIDRNITSGGMTASFSYRGLVFDFGSHRLHPAASHELLKEIQHLMGSELLERPRNGRIFLDGRFVKFPLKPVDLMLNLPPSFSLGTAWDLISGPFRKKACDSATFRKVLISGLGPTISEKFYFPYAEKLWGLPPELLHGVQARKRISSGSIGKILLKALKAVTGSGQLSNTFYYPAGGFGRICEKTADRIESLGGRIIKGSIIAAIDIRDRGMMITSEADDGHSEEIEEDFIFSTIPVTELCKVLSPRPPERIIKSLGELSYRSMILCFLELDIPHYTEYDAHYFPGKDIIFSRMSEPKNYSNSSKPPDRTGLCFEIPCWSTDTIWGMSDEEIAEIVIKNLELTGLPTIPVISSFVKRISHAYPSYSLGYRIAFDKVDDYLKNIGNFVTLGRQGLFAHDNTHHTIEMGVAAADCFSPETGLDRNKWSSRRAEFEKHVVVD
jgi:protoporphyrinogen oxidase